MSLSATSFSVDEYDVPASTPRLSRRIILNQKAMKQCKLMTGDLVAIRAEPQLKKGSSFAVASAWPDTLLEPNAIQLSGSAMLTAGLEAGGTAYLSPINEPISNFRKATQLTLEEISDSGSSSGADNHEWLLTVLREKLVDLQLITIHQQLDLEYFGRKRTFRVVSESPLASSSDALPPRFRNLSLSEPSSTMASEVWCVSWDTEVLIATPKVAIPATSPVKVDPYARVGGLTKQIAEVRDLIELPLSNPALYSQFGLKPPRGILLYGPPGTGKTHLARAIASASGASLLTVSGPELTSAFHGETESKLRDIFSEAHELSPCIIVLDEVDAICPKREDSGAGIEARVVTTLLTLMDGMDTGSGQSRVVVVATTNRPNAIDPALRRPGRFDREIEIGIPDAPARLSILSALLARVPHTITPKELKNISSRTHGYVGADLSAAIRDAGSLAIKRMLHDSAAEHSTNEGVTYDDLLTAISHIRPSALREHFIESPAVKWSDIGGQEEVKQKLKESVEWPLLHPEAFTRLGVTAPRGVLLYGPPGCSKTLTAKALATESGINFIAVKGPELLNKYVGESERAVREIFRKARGASPSIVFFDEIDALATSRASNDGNSHQGVLTSLLNEMDGIQDSMGVVVVAATNRPDVLDSALMRPGRLDRILYVGPPDVGARCDIIRIKLSKMSVEEGVSIDELAQLTNGCSGAEITAMCQEAALLTMRGNLEAPCVLREDFVRAAKAIRRQITPAMINEFVRWRDSSGLPAV